MNLTLTPIIPDVRWIRQIPAVAAALCFCGAALAAPVVHYDCRHEAGGHYWNSMSFSVDYGAKTVEAVPGNGGGMYLDDIEITDAQVTWSVMRGFFVFDRKSGHVDWDMTAEYDYLVAIDQPPTDLESDYKGSMQCVVSDKPKP